jgi:DNA repair exonuclease SbcCD ATPase subunit
MNDYEIKRQLKLDRFKELAEKNREAATKTAEYARTMLDVIPFGQPILVGHHSERADRNYRNRIQSKFEKANELQDKAAYYERRAQAIASNRAIFSDDPNATEKLEAKIARLEKQQEVMREFNKLLRKGDTEGMLNLGFTEEQIAKLSLPDFCGRRGFPDYALTNNSGNIRRLKQRVATLEQHSQDTTSTFEFGDITVIDNVEINRVQILFPGKPSEEIRGRLKFSGFRWSPTEGAWQRQRCQYALDIAKRTAESCQAGNERGEQL